MLSSVVFYLAKIQSHQRKSFDDVADILCLIIVVLL